MSISALRGIYCVVRKQDVEAIQLEIDWSDLLKDSETIAAQFWSQTSGLSVTEVPQVDGNFARATVSGGVAGKTYKVGCDIETTTGQFVRRTILVGVYRCP